MTLTSVKFVPYEMKTSIINVYSYLKKNPMGTLHNAYFGSEQYFDNLTQLLIILENLQDAISYPQKSMEWRTFNKDKTMGNINQDARAEYQDKHPLATFRINIIFRHNASWQGSVRWVENSAETEFRSALELIFLMDSVLTGMEQ